MIRNNTTLFDEIIKARKIRNSSINTNIQHEKTKKKKSYSKPDTGTKSAKTNSDNVVVKITGGASNSKSASRHLDYISRNNQVDIYDKDNQKIDYDEMQLQSHDNIESDHCRSDSKKTYQMVFSTNGINDKESLREAIMKTAQEELKGYNFYIAIHEDTKNTHAHLVVYRGNDTGKRLKIDKKKLNQIKKKYSQNLNKVGIKSHFQSHSDKFKKSDNHHKFKKERINSNHFKLVDYGEAPYQFNVGSPNSFYALLENKNGTTKQLWSWGLKDEITKQSIKRGDIITVKKMKSDTPAIDGKNKSVWSIRKNEDQYEGKFFSIVDYGKAKYRFNENSKESFYLLLKNSKNETKQVWNKKIERFLQDNQLKKGDNIALTDTNLLKISDQKITQQQSIISENKEVINNKNHSNIKL